MKLNNFLKNIKRTSKNNSNFYFEIDNEGKETFYHRKNEDSEYVKYDLSKCYSPRVFAENIKGDKYTCLEYCSFMYSYENIEKCDHCPENKGLDNEKRPCGLKNCMVKLHLNIYD